MGAYSTRAGEINYCEICGQAYAERHHIIFRSQAKYLENIPLNFKELCGEHHRGNSSPHRCRAIDKKYKLEYQRKVMELFAPERFYQEQEVMELLSITQSEARRLLKKLMPKKEGYAGEEIIIRMMGGRIYNEI